jgi:WD40 repeat protein/serine/threonine protein kinase
VILDEYEVKHILGEGGMGKVYLVHSREWDLDLAVKSPKAELFQTQVHKENFVRECHTWMDLGLHPHTVTCHYVRVLGGIPRVFAEFVDGGSLQDWVDDGRLYEGGLEKALERILHIAIQFAWGLQHAHDKGLIHKDVKPANVMMTSDGTAKVTDFGLSNARAMQGVGQNGAEGHNVLASIRGMTPAYCSPEQAENDAQRDAGIPHDQITALTPATDIYSWAVSVFHMFNGSVTWKFGNIVGFALDVCLQSGPADSKLPKMPQEVANLLKECLADDPQDRPESTREVADELAQIYRLTTGSEYPASTPAPATELADVLNNKALSFLELGNAERAEALWREALKLDAHHIESTYNLSLHEWRSARILPVELVRRMNEILTSDKSQWRAQYLLGLLHLEARDGELASRLLERIQEPSNYNAKVVAALTRARSIPRANVHTINCHDPIISGSLSTDGRWALSAHGPTLRLWDVESGRCERVFEGHTHAVTTVCLSRNGRWALSRSDDTLQAWDVATGRCMRTFDGGHMAIHSVSVIEDRRWALSGGSDATLRLWEIASVHCLRTFAGHWGDVWSVCISADGCWALASDRGSADTLQVWDVATAQCMRTFDGHTAVITSVSVSADGRWALSGGSDATLRLWEVASGRCLRTFEGHWGHVSSVCLSGDGYWAVSGGQDDTLRLWEVNTGRCLRCFEHRGQFRSVSLSADAHLALSINEYGDRLLKIWKLDLKSRIDSLLRAPHLFCRVESADKRRLEDSKFMQFIDGATQALAAGKIKEGIKQIHAARGLLGREKDNRALELNSLLKRRSLCSGIRNAWPVRTIDGRGILAYSLSVSGDGLWALTAGDDEMLRLWDLATGRCVRTFEGHKGTVHSASLSFERRCVLSGGQDGTLRLWDLAEGSCLSKIKAHEGCVTALALSADRRLAVTGGTDKILRLWELTSGRCLRTLEGHTDDVNSAHVTSDGRWALSGGQDGTLRMWLLSTGQCVRILEGQQGEFFQSIVSADMRWVFSVSADNYSVRLWDLTTGRCLRMFEGHHKDIVHSICITLDGRWAISSSSDSTLRLWEVATGRCVRILEAREYSVILEVDVSADARWVISAGDHLQLWELDWELEAADPADWDEGARPYVDNFLTLHTPYAGTLPDDRAPSDEEVTLALTRRGRPSWTDDDFKQLLYTLGCAGYGWLRPEGVKRELEKMAASWTGPLPLFG